MSGRIDGVLNIANDELRDVAPGMTIRGDVSATPPTRNRRKNAVWITQADEDALNESLSRDIEQLDTPSTSKSQKRKRLEPLRQKNAATSLDGYTFDEQELNATDEAFVKRKSHQPRESSPHDEPGFGEAVMPRKLQQRRGRFQDRPAFGDSRMRVNHVPVQSR